MDKTKLKEIFLYLLFGILTTIVALGVYYALVFTILNPESPFELQISNVISWIFAVFFAYFTNRKWVFESKNDNIPKEIIKFFSARIFSLLLDMLIMFVFVSFFKMNDKIIKLISQVVVILSNYVLSKFFVFRSAHE